MSQKILVVDDKPFMLRLIQHHLEKAGFELIQARNGQEAMEAVAAESPLLVVMDDSQMMAKEGKGLTQLRKKDSQLIPVIRMSNTPPTLRKEDCPSNVVVLTRPFSPTQLVSEVKRLMPRAGVA